MSKKEIGLWLVTADFVCLTVYAMFTQGYFAFVPIAIEFASSSVWGVQILADFLIALSVALGWVVADARKRGLPYLPYVALTLTLGSIGPLAYLIHRERASAPAAASARPAAQAA